MSKLPSFQFYPGDWWKDPGIQMLSLEERGFWLQCLLLMHESEERGKMMINGAAIPDDGIARAMGVDNQTTNQIITKLITYGVTYRCETTGALCNRRMIRDEEIRKIHASCGKMGGKPRLPTQNHNQTPNQTANQNITPSSSSSSSSSEVPPNPQGGDGEEIAEPKKSQLLPTTPEALAIAELFNRKPTTEWAQAEVRAFKKLLPIDCEDFELVEKYHLAQKAKGDAGIHRRDLKTFLNNFRGELDRARAWSEQPLTANKSGFAGQSTKLL